MNHSSAKALKAKFKVSRASARRVGPSEQAALRVDLVFVANGNASRGVAVSVSPMVPDPGNGYKILSDDEICDWLQQWGFAIDEETQVPPPDRTVNAADPISISRGLSDLVELLSEAVPRPAA